MFPNLDRVFEEYNIIFGPEKGRFYETVMRDDVMRMRILDA